MDKTIIEVDVTGLTPEQIEDIHARAAVWRGDDILTSSGIVRDCAFFTTHRRKPRPRYIPWTRETCPPLPFEVVVKSTGNRAAVLIASAEYVRFGGFDASVGYDQLLKDYTLRDGSPCGTKVG